MTLWYNTFHLDASLFVLLAFSMYTGISHYLKYKKLKEQHVIKYERNNCIVMFAQGYLSGWPPNKERIKCGVGKLDILFEPIIYFIDIAEKTLDIAVMVIVSDKYTSALVAAKNRGVSIRIISQFEKNRDVMKKLKKLGISAIMFVPIEENFPKLFHIKCMIRDKGTRNQCVCLGSMNYSVTGATENYEDIVFTQVPCIVESACNIFENSWEIISEDNNSLYKKSVLQHADLL